VHLTLARRAAGVGDGARPGLDLLALRRAGQPLLEAHALPEAALAERAAGDLDTAAAHLVRGLRLARLAGDPLAEGVALYGLGEVHAGAGRPAPAGRCLDRAVDRFTELGAPYWRSRALLARAALRDRQRRPADSRRDRHAAAATRRRLPLPAGADADLLP
jgi:tetratricopeptide (TPR) repeat protein